MAELTAEETAIFDDVSKLASSLWDKSKKIEGLNTDPKMYSVMLFQRLFSNHRAFTLLSNDGFRSERATILRSGLETSICIAANFKLRDEFVLLVRRDAAATLQKQIKLYRDRGETEMVKGSEEALRGVQKGLPKGVKATTLNWRELADHGGVPRLYDWYRGLSALFSHVTGLSIIENVSADDGSEALQRRYRRINDKLHPMMMAGATLDGALRHAGMINDLEGAESTKALLDRFNGISAKWPDAIRAMEG